MKQFIFALLLCCIFLPISVNAKSSTVEYLHGRYIDESKWEFLSRTESYLVFFDKQKMVYYRDGKGNLNTDIVVVTENFYYINVDTKNEVQEYLIENGYKISADMLDYEVYQRYYDLKKNQVTTLWRYIYNKKGEKVYEEKFPNEFKEVTELSEVYQMLHFRKIKNYVNGGFLTINK